jgi:hypothetical protein
MNIIDDAIGTIYKQGLEQTLQSHGQFDMFNIHKPLFMQTGRKFKQVNHIYSFKRVFSKYVFPSVKHILYKTLQLNTKTRTKLKYIHTRWL